MKGLRAAKSYIVTGGGGTKLYVEEGGNPDGQPLVFIHGFNQSRYVWAKQFQSELLQDFRLIAFDNRGHGWSEKPVEAYQESEWWAKDLDAVLTELQVKKPILIGWSYGGLVVFDYLRFIGEKAIGGVNLVGARSRIGTTEAAAETGKDYHALKPKLLANEMTAALEGIATFLALCSKRRLPPEEYYYFLGFNAMIPPYVRQALMKRTLSNEDIMTKLSTPFLITHGKEDQVVLPSHALYNRNQLTHATLSSYEETGHMPFWEQEQRFNQELKDFADTIMQEN
ncbi:alpha/beta fold hydrolase [Halalkalibacter oceani]|uniref:alpha/beta fold hydrolase n=1 Tax=Halalkalibacter oceani TaxID=1653776 RepID=UPI0033932B08